MNIDGSCFVVVVVCFVLFFVCFVAVVVVVFVWLVVFRVVVLIFNSETLFLLGLVLFFHFHCHVSIEQYEFLFAHSLNNVLSLWSVDYRDVIFVILVFFLTK